MTTTARPRSLEPSTLPAPPPAPPPPPPPPPPAPAGVPGAGAADPAGAPDRLGLRGGPAPTTSGCEAVDPVPRLQVGAAHQDLPAVAVRPAMRGLEIVFDDALDEGGWPGPGAGARGAPAGEAWLGPLGLLDRLELELGLRRVHALPLERAVELAGALAGRDGPWSRSLEVDPVATAERLLADRDALRLHGWRGEAAGARLAALWSATAAAAPGVPDRLDRVRAALAGRRTAIAAVHAIEPIAEQPPLWRQTLEALGRAGTRLCAAPLPRVAGAGDLGAARAAIGAVAGARGAAFTPAGDGTLQLVRPHGVLAAADEVAACLAACPDLHGVVVIGADAVLDAALGRHGLPRLGARVPPPASAALVRLCVEAAFQPVDAADLHALVCLDPGPVPRAIAWRLTQALGRFPGRGSPEWREALARGLAALDEPARAGVAERLAALLEPAAAREAPLPLPALAARMGALAGWARGRLAAAPSLAGVAAAADRLVALARLGGRPLTLAALRGLCDRLAEDAVRGEPAELGLAGIAQPGALLESPRVAVWWGFSRAGAPRAHRLRISPAERAALAAAGVIAPGAGAAMAREARRWRRPLALAEAALVLVCPRLDEAGAPAHPHPLWDELCAALPEPALAERLRSPRMALPAAPAADARRPRGEAATWTPQGEAAWITARRARAAARPRPAPAERATTARALGLRALESASSVEALLGCSFAYALRYAGELSPGLATPAAAPGPNLYGHLAHLVLARVLAGGAPEPAAAARGALAILDAELPRLAETLLLPEHQAERAALRRAIALAARAVAESIARAGAAVRGVEVALEGRLGPATLSSRADLLLSEPDHVIDFKWGGARHRDELRAGAAVQLALYAALARTGPRLPGVAYLLARTQRLVAARGSGLPGASEATPYTAAELLRVTEAALERRLGELAGGALEAPGALDDPRPSGVAEGALRVAPPCAYCELDGLCGRRGRP